MPWWVPLLAALLAGGIGLGAGLSSIFLTRRFTSEQKHDERLEELRREQRDVLVDLIDVLDRWGPMTELFVMLMAQDDQSRETMKFLETDSGKALLEATKELKRVIVRCLLTVVDEELRPLVVQVDELVRSRESMHKEVLRLATFDQVKAVGLGMAYAAQVQRLSGRLQETAVHRLSTPSTPPGRRERRLPR